MPGAPLAVPAIGGGWVLTVARVVQHGEVERDGLTLVVQGDVPSARVGVVGDLDISTAPRLAAHLAALRRHGYRTVELDLSRLTFLGAAGLAVFCEGAAQLGACGGHLRLVGVSPRVRRLVALAGLDAVLAVEDPSGPAVPAPRRP